MGNYSVISDEEMSKIKEEVDFEEEIVENIRKSIRVEVGSSKNEEFIYAMNFLYKNFSH